MARTRKRKVQLPALSEPEFLSLVGKPANRTGFKMVRSDDGQLTKLRRRLRRTDQNLLSIDLPSGITREAAESLMELFGMQDEYEIRERTDGAYTLKRINSDTPEGGTIAISLGEGIIANVASEAFSRQDSAAGNVSNPDYHQERSKKGTESYDTYTESTVEESKGGYKMAEIRFSTAVYDTVETVKEWLARNDIDFNENGVEVTDGEVIVSRHDDKAEGYRVPIAEGVVGVLEMSDRSDIPESIHKTVLASLLSQARSDNPTTEHNEMSEEKRTDTTDSDKNQEVTTQTQEAESKILSRKDVEDIVAAAVAEALAKRDEANAAAEEGDKEEARNDDSTESLLKTLVEKVESLGSSVEGIRKDVDELGEATVTRSEPESEGEEKRKDPASIFSGIFG